MTGTFENMRMGKNVRIERKLAAACVCLTGSGILMLCAAKVEGFAEWYAQHIYPVLVSVIGRVFGVFPFSAAEVGVYAGAVVLIGTAVRMVLKTARGTNGAEPVLSWAAGLFLTASVLLFLYVVNCGINYHRIPFSEKSGILTEAYTVEELKDTCEWLTDEVDRRADEVRRDADGIMRLDPAEGKDAILAMENLAEEYPALQGYYPRPKPLIVSEILSYQSLSGVYLPFTIEANYNADMVPYNIPFTACHELSHLRGFMQEEEANFIAFLACTQADRIDFQYSGYLLGWIYGMNALRRADEESWQEVRKELDEAVEADLQANSRFWNAYDGAVAEVSNKVNDTYLKANGQSDGVQSYNRMVDLMVAYHQSVVSAY